MEANELRIGNYVNAPAYWLIRNGDNSLMVTKVETISKGWYSVKGKSKYDLCINHQFYETGSEWGPSIEIYCKPIPLDEIWLSKFGFHYTEQEWYYKEIEDNHLTINIKSKKTVIGSKNCVKEAWNININHCKYVHQLQNLYFALKGKELEIKEY